MLAELHARHLAPSSCRDCRGLTSNRSLAGFESPCRCASKSSRPVASLGLVSAAAAGPSGGRSFICANCHLQATYRPPWLPCPCVVLETLQTTLTLSFAGALKYQPADVEGPCLRASSCLSNLREPQQSSPVTPLPGQATRGQRSSRPQDGSTFTQTGQEGALGQPARAATGCQAPGPQHAA